MRLSFLHFIIGLAYLTLVVPAQALGSLGGDTLAINDSRSTVHTESSKSVGCSIDSIVCGHSGWGLPERDAAREAVRYLRSLPGEWSLDPGPGRCFRASCSYNTGVWICNDVGFDPAASFRRTLVPGEKRRADI
ncbi:hypothetical protein EJ08DRAFT_692139 [Tothia fuscella]|uniref:Secreted protein n=1 Tax=Tothia fuscella TaxID=1048955 RepID=A0A9P4P2V5_9PEZI|nr:hypothetical protein EJ08DRAFT_692139 [Tothia fuscella]